MTDPAQYEIQVFRDGRPAIREYPPADRDRTRTLLLEAAETDQGGARHRRSAGAPRRGRRLRGPVLAGTVAAAVAAAVAVPLLASGRPVSGGSVSEGPVSGAQTPAMAVLEKTAATAARQPTTPVPGPGQYLYLRDIEFRFVGGPNTTKEERECTALVGQEWMAADGSGHQSGHFTSSYPGCQGFEQSWGKGGVSTSENPMDWPKNLLNWQRLPASPAAIERAIVRRFENGHALSSATFVYAAAYLQEDAPPALRAALYRVIEQLPGVTSLGPVTDRLGRHGIGVGLVHDGTRQELIFDPATSTALESAIVAVGPRQDRNDYQPAGTVIEYVAYVATGLVNSATATLPARATPTAAGS
jgi:hypothetical protein